MKIARPKSLHRTRVVDVVGAKVLQQRSVVDVGHFQKGRVRRVNHVDHGVRGVEAFGTRFRGEDLLCKLHS